MKKSITNTQGRYSKPATIQRLGFHKPGLLLGAALSLFLLQAARADTSLYSTNLPFYEPFASTNSAAGCTYGYWNTNQLGNPNNNSGKVWNYGNSATFSSSFIYMGSGLAIPGLATIVDTNTYNPNFPVGTDMKMGLRSYAVGKNRGACFYPVIGDTTNNEHTVYASFLYRFECFSNSPGDRIYFNLSNTNMGTTPPTIVGFWVNSQVQLGISKNTAGTPGVYTAASYTNGTHLIVLSYKIATNDNDSVNLWVDPLFSLGADDSHIPPPLISTTNNANSRTFRSVAYMASGTIPIVIGLDEIRVGTNWADVTPPSCISIGSIYTVTGGGMGCSGLGVDVGLSGSQTGVSYWLWTNNVFSGQMTNGSGPAVSYGPQTVNGTYTVLASNTTSGCVWWLTNSVTATIGAPYINIQPVAVTVATNAMGVYSVNASGANLAFKWRKNGSDLTDGGQISGSQTPYLTVSPATTADEATSGNGYDVVITGSCGTTNSSRVGLTLAQSGNLFWHADGVTNLWDVSTTPNWTNSAGTGVAFNFGDNVTFDDTYTPANLNVNLASAYLAPSTMTVAGSHAFVFYGNGNILGPGQLVVNTAGGSLTMHNFYNGFSGGTVVSNGLLEINYNSALGSGLLTFGGGELRVVGLLVITNDISITKHSIVSVSSDTYMDATAINWTGSDGAWTIKNNGTSHPSLRFRGLFNCNVPIGFDAGFGAYPILGGYNTNGVQTFSGIISGGGSFVHDGGGASVLTAQNWYQGGTILTAGTIGFGCDTTGSIDSGPIGTGTLTNGISSDIQVYAAGGAHTVANNIAYPTNLPGSALTIGGTNALTLSGTFDLCGTNRIIRATNTAASVISGVILDGSGATGSGLTMTGNGTLTLSNINTYKGPTIVGGGTLLINGTNDIGAVTVSNNATLGGSGMILGAVTIQTNGTLAAGGSAIGTLTVSNNLTLYGNIFVRVNKLLAPAATNDFALISGTLLNAGAGTVTVTNLGSVLAPSNSFKLFSKALTGGGSLTITGAGVTWSNKLATDGSIVVLSTNVGLRNPPVFYSSVVQIDGKSLLMSGTNSGDAGTSFYVLSSTNVTQPLTNWTRIYTGTFAGTLFSVTNTITNGPMMFYIIQLP